MYGFYVDLRERVNRGAMRGTEGERYYRASWFIEI